jgi:Endosomal/lysosomal potassium channel TMEM175
VLLGWPTYLAYLVSFLTIGATWLAHTAMTDQLKRADSILLRLNLLLLMVVVFLPFPTHLVAEYLNEPSSERVFVTMYGLTLLLIRVLLFTLDAYARREHLFCTEGTDQDLSAYRKKGLPSSTPLRPPSPSFTPPPRRRGHETAGCPWAWSASVSNYPAHVQLECDGSLDSPPSGLLKPRRFKAAAAPTPISPAFCSGKRPALAASSASTLTLGDSARTCWARSDSGYSRDIRGLSRNSTSRYLWTSALTWHFALVDLAGLCVNRLPLLQPLQNQAA